jgi:hypothetical protein
MVDLNLKNGPVSSTGLHLFRRLLFPFCLFKPIGAARHQSYEPPFRRIHDETPDVYHSFALGFGNRNSK